MSYCDTCTKRDLSYGEFPCRVCWDGSYYEPSDSSESEESFSAPIESFGETFNDCGRFEKMLGVVTEIVELLEKKNNDYGNSATQTYEEYGDVAFFIRISDKINRLKSLTINNKTQEVKDESIDDTVKDIIGYCLLYLEWKNSKEDK